MCLTNLEMTCEEIIDDGVETIVYRPRSYIEEEPESMFDTSLPTKNDNKNKSYEKISTGKRGSFTDIRNAILTRVNTPRGHRRSKTIVQRCQSAGETLKIALGRTSSLDVVRNNQKQSMDDLTNGFSKLADKTLEKLPIEAPTDNSENVDEVAINVISNIRGKDRSQSCPSYPIILEENRKRCKKSSSYDSSTCSIEESKICRSFDKHNPTIKVELCTTENNHVKSEPLQRKWSTKNTSNSSLNSNHTDSSGGYSSSDNSCVFINEISVQNTTISKTAVNITLDKIDSSTEKKRPKSFIDYFRREKDSTEYCNTLPLPRKNNKQIVDFNETSISSALDSDSDEDIFNERSRSTSMVELSENRDYSTDNNISNVQHKRVKKTSSNIYGLASPTTLKRLFKKKKKNTNASKKRLSTPITPLSPSSVANRKCVHIESLL